LAAKIFLVTAGLSLKQFPVRRHWRNAPSHQDRQYGSLPWSGRRLQYLNTIINSLLPRKFYF